MSDKLCLQIEDLTISFGGIKAVDHLSFSIKEGEIYGLIGPNGAGKTTVFNCITQFYKPHSGKVLFNDRKNETIDLVKLKTHQIIKHGLVRTFQNVELINELSVVDNLLVGSHINFKTGIISHGLKTKKARKEEAELKQKALDILSYLGIYDKRDELIAGQQ